MLITKEIINYLNATGRNVYG